MQSVTTNLNNIPSDNLNVAEIENLSEGESQFENINMTEDISMINVNESRIIVNKNKTNFSNKKKTKNKYKDDIIHILKYAEDNNPLSLVMEICALLKWEHPEIESFQMVENEVNVYKTQMKLKSFKGEGIGITKKISKKKASVELITHMVLDKTVRDSMRIYIDTKSINRDCKLKEDNEEVIKLNEEEFEKPFYKEEENNQNRVKQIITSFNKNILENPLSQLDSFRNKFNIPFCFTYTIKEKMHKAVLYVGGEICNKIYLNNFIVGFGVDVNIRVAKYKAAIEAVKKIRSKYGEEALKYKAVERRKNKLIMFDEEQKKKEACMNPIPCRINFDFKGEEIMKSINDLHMNNNEENSPNKNLEIFLLKYERSLIPQIEYFEIHKILSLIFFSNKNFSIHFSNPILSGSFQYDCASNFNLVIDITFFHEITLDKFKEALEMLITKFKINLKDVSNEVVANITNRINETNLDIIIKLKNKNFSFRFLIRDSDYKHQIYYLRIHNEKLNNGVRYPIIFNSLRRIIRIFRRQNKLLSIQPEIFDWIIKVFLTDSLSESLMNIIKNLAKNFRNIFIENDVPEFIKNEVEILDEMDVKKIQVLFNEIVQDLKNEDFKKIMKLA